MANEAPGWLLPDPTVNRLLLLADLAVLGPLGWGVRRAIGLGLVVPLSLLTIVWLGMATNNFFLALTLFHLTSGVAGLVLARRVSQPWVAIVASGLLAGTPILALVT